MFSFNLRLKRPMNDMTEDKENVFKPMTPFSMRSESSVGQKSSQFPLNMTPIQSSLFFNRTNDSAKSQKSFEMVSEKSKPSEVLGLDSTVQQISEDSNALKQRVVAELERIETFNRMTELEIDRQSDEILYLKKLNEDLEKRLNESQNQNSELTVKLKVESTERQGVLTRMNHTRDMLNGMTQVVEHLENRLEALDDVKNAFDLVNENRSQDINELNQRFSRLHIKHKTIVSQMESEITQKNTEWNVLKEALDRKTYDLELHINESNKKFDALAEELNKYEELKKSLESKLNEKEFKIRELGQNNESLLITIQKKDHELENLRNDSDIKVKELEENIENLVNKENNLIKRNDELLAEIQNKEEKNTEFEAEIEKKNQTIADFENDIKDKDKQLEDLLSEKTNILQLNDELNSKVESIRNESKEFETSFQTEKNSIISGFEKTNSELMSKVEAVNEEKNQLIQWKEEKLLLIEDLESKANQTIVEKEAIEEKLKTDLKQLKDDFENKMSDYSLKIAEMEKRINELEALKEQNETTINEMLNESVKFKDEREELKQKLEKEERTLETQMANMSKIVDSCKSDYNKRIEDKEIMIKDFRKENERMRANIEYLNKKCQELEAEKKSVNHKLQELTLSMSRPNTSATDKVLTPKFMSSMESSRASGGRSSGSWIRPLSFSPIMSSTESVLKDLSAKQELEENLKFKSSQSSEPIKGFPELNSAEKDLKSKNESKKVRQLKKLVKPNESSSESVYELITEKGFQKDLLKLKKGIRKQKDGSKHRIDSPVRVDMKTEKKNKKDIDTDTDEYDIEKVDKYEPKEKKLKSLSQHQHQHQQHLKTYAKKGLRADNIKKGRPTPTKEADLSWLNF